MRMIKFITSRMVLTGAVVLVQLLWLLVFWIKLSQYSGIISTAFVLLSLLATLYVMTNTKNPSFRTGWVIIIMAVPLVGGLLYFFFGNKRPQKKMVSKIAGEEKKIASCITLQEKVEEEVFVLDRRKAGLVSYLQNICGFPVWKNTQTDYYALGEDMYEEMLLELKKAEHFIFMEYFILEKGQMWERIFVILKEKVAAGVDVRLIYDDVGCLNLLPPSFSQKMEREGIKCMPFNPFVPVLSLVVNNRDHRKILVIDGQVAFTGGINIADEYINVKVRYGHWKDTGIKLTGEAVQNFTLMFLEIWNAYRNGEDDYAEYIGGKYHARPQLSDGFVLPFGSSPLDEEDISQNLYLDIINQAVDYVYIFTPYLIIDDEMEKALCLAAKRKVDVRLITPGIPDKKIVNRMTRSYYRILLANGVKIYEYTPGFVHAKSYVCDDVVGVVGTVNMDFRSLYHHFECGAYLYGTSSITAIKQDFLSTQEQCQEIKLDSLDHRLFFRLLDSLIRIFAPLM